MIKAHFFRVVVVMILSVIVILLWQKESVVEPFDTSLERVNKKVVIDFCAAWEKQNIDEFMAFIDDDVLFKFFDGEEPVRGKDKMYEMTYELLSTYSRVRCEITKLVAVNNIVASERIEHFQMLNGGHKDIIVSGVFIVKDGIIMELLDYTVDEVLIMRDGVGMDHAVPSRPIENLKGFKN